MISTIHDNSIEVVKARRGEIEKPTCILQYNKQMGGVDLADNYLHFCGTSRCRVKKMYMKIFHHMLGKDHYTEPFEIIILFLGVTTLNSYHIYKKLGGKVSRLNLLIHLGEKLIEKYSKPVKTRTRRSRTPQPSRLIERHFPSIIPPTTKEKHTKRYFKTFIIYCQTKKFFTGVLSVRKLGNERKVGIGAKNVILPPCFRKYHTRE